MRAKIKLPFHELENEFPTIISREELMSILGGSYGYDPNSWGSSQESFLNNVSDMMYNGMFNFAGGGSTYSAEFNVSDFYSPGGSDGSGGSGFAGGGSFTMPGIFDGMSSGSNNWNFGTVSNNNNLFTFGSAVTSGSNQSPGPLIGSFNGLKTEFIMPGGQNPQLKFIQPDGSTMSIKFSDGKLSIGVSVKF